MRNELRVYPMQVELGLMKGFFELLCNNVVLDYCVWRKLAIYIKGGYDIPFHISLIHDCSLHCTKNNTDFSSEALSGVHIRVCLFTEMRYVARLA